MSLGQVIAATNVSAKKIHGSDISILVARAIAFGNDDNLIIVRGANHRLAAADLVKVTPGAMVTEISHPETDWGDGVVMPAYTSSQVTF